MANSFWLENGMDEAHGKHTLVDLGYSKEPAAWSALQRLLPFVGRRNLQLVGNGRITVRLPPRKRDELLKRFPEIVEGAAGYCWCSHGWNHSHVE